MQEFIEIFKYINLLIYYARTTGKKIKNIDDSIKKYVKITIKKVEQKYDKEKIVYDLLEEFPDCELFLEKKKIFIKLDPLKDWRGKFFYSFFVKFLSVLKEDRINKNPIYFKKYKKVNFNPHSDIIRTLASISEAPECLKKFISNLSVLSQSHS